MLFGTGVYFGSTGFGGFGTCGSSGVGAGTPGFSGSGVNGFGLRDLSTGFGSGRYLGSGIVFFS